MENSTEHVVSVIGSHMHETATKDSDVDLRYVNTTSLRQMLSPFTAKTIKAKVTAADHVTYEMRHFLALLQSGSPSVIDIVYSPHVSGQTELGSELIANRRCFIDAERARTNLIHYCTAMMKDATEGVRPYKSLRAAVLTGNVVLAFLEQEEYDPLTVLGRNVILDSIGEPHPYTEEQLRTVIRFLLDTVSKVPTVDEFNPAYVEDFNYRAYTEGLCMSNG